MFCIWLQIFDRRASKLLTHTQMISWIYRKIDPFPLSPREKVFSRIEDGKEAVIFIVEIDRLFEFNIYRLR